MKVIVRVRVLPKKAIPFEIPKADLDPNSCIEMRANKCAAGSRSYSPPRYSHSHRLHRRI